MCYKKCVLQAISVTKDDTLEKAVYYKNRAAAHLKQQEFEKAMEDCTKALEISPSDTKALFRRCQAYDALGKFEEAYKDARTVHNVDPGNTAIQPILARLHEIVANKVAEHSKLSSKVSLMLNLAFDISTPIDKRETAANNILVLAKEKAGAELLYKEGILNRIVSLFKIEKNQNIIVNLIRSISVIAKNNADKARGIIEIIGLPWIIELLNTRYEEQISAAQYCLQTLLDALSGMTLKDEKTPDVELCSRNRKEIDTLITCLIYALTSRTMTGVGRDAMIELILRNCDYRALDWAERIIDINGLQRLMEVASELPEFKYESSMEVTDNTRTTVSVCLAKVYDNMYYENARGRFVNKIEDFIKNSLVGPEIECRVRVTVALTTLLLGPLDVGSSFLAKDGILEMILVMANTDDFLQQRVACEAMIAAASKKDKVKALIAQGTNILKKLYVSKDDGIKVRALVGLCKLGASGGTDASIRPFADGSTLKLAEACRRFLVNPAKDKDMRKWAAEGLSYLTLDAEVKEKLIEDSAAVQALIELAKTGDHSVVYGVVTTLVNLTNSYDKKEIMPEMLELAKFAKHHIPEEHELDDPDFVYKRVEVLGKEGVTSALVALSKVESHNSKELIARIFNAICEQHQLRGYVVQQGGCKALLHLASEGTAKGKLRSAQALARIGITINPEVAFPGQRQCEVVRPLLALLHPECSALETFEGLMALCNLAGFELPRKSIIKDRGVSTIESYMVDSHEMLKKAAVQCWTNLVQSEEVMKMHEGNNDRVKLLVLLCADEDIDTAVAASGALAILTSMSKRCCRKVFEPKDWLDILRYLLTHQNLALRHRGVTIVYNMLGSGKELAEKLTEVMEVMNIVRQLDITDDPVTAKIKDLAEKSIKIAEEMKLIERDEHNDVE
ncbi:hypothetical protein QYM36_000098 [Artemia franciscana]|uniref:Protein unc-45 homolog B n=1 Tax=Artemia franciscana TaxID=6661 RepID=A0AA88LKN2_ARTSF|nr:hypothetical protein QYM36_000098 [Artemia franciscana]